MEDLAKYLLTKPENGEVYNKLCTLFNTQNMNPEAAILESINTQAQVDAVTMNPFGLNLIAQNTKIILHVESRDISKGGIMLTPNAKKELAEAEALNDSKLYYIIGVAEHVVISSAYRPGMWVLLSPDTMGHKCKINGKEFLLVDVYNISGVITYHEDRDVESQYTSGSDYDIDKAKVQAQVAKLNYAGRNIDGESYQTVN